MQLGPNERIDDLNRCGYKIIQNTDKFCFGMDAVLLSEFAKASKGDKVVDLGTGTGIIPILMEAKTDAESYLFSYGNIISKSIVKDAIIGFVFSLIVAVCLIFFKDAVSPIVKLEIGMFTELVIVYLVICLVLFVGILVLMKIKPGFWLFSSEKKSLKYYFNIGYAFNLINFFVSALLVVYFILLLIITPTTVIGNSMYDTFNEGDKIFVWHAFYNPSRNDIIVIDASRYSYDDSENFYIKR